MCQRPKAPSRRPLPSLRLGPCKGLSLELYPNLSSYLYLNSDLYRRSDLNLSRDPYLSSDSSLNRDPSLSRNPDPNSGLYLSSDWNLSNDLSLNDLNFSSGLHPNSDPCPSSGLHWHQTRDSSFSNFMPRDQFFLSVVTNQYCSSGLNTRPQ